MERARLYYELTKPRVTYGNVLTAIAGFLLAAKGQIDPATFAAFTAGITLVIAAACALNNHLDRDIDSKMTRTKQRPTVSGAISGPNAVVFSVVLVIIGLGLLIAFTNLLTAAVGLFGFIVYVWLYGAWSKRRSIHGTLVGSLSGAAPILAGYTAVSGVIDLGGLLLFLILFLWQMPEFYSIAIYRRKEYKAAGVPVMTVVKGVENTKWQILAYTAAFLLAAIALWIFGYTGFNYLAVMTALGGYWLWLAIQGVRTHNDDRWSRQMFGFSLVILVVFSFLISIEGWMP